MSDTTANALDVDNYLDSFGESSMTDKGVIIIRSNSNADSSFFIFKVIMDTNLS